MWPRGVGSSFIPSSRRHCFLYTSRSSMVVVVVRVRLGYYPSHRWYHFQCSSAGHSSTLSSLPLPLSFLLHPVFFSRIVHLACASFLRLLNISRWGRVRGTWTRDCSTTKLLLCAMCESCPQSESAGRVENSRSMPLKLQARMMNDRASAGQGVKVQGGRVVRAS